MLSFGYSKLTFLSVLLIFYHNTGRITGYLHRINIGKRILILKDQKIYILYLWNHVPCNGCPGIGKILEIKTVINRFGRNNRVIIIYRLAPGIGINNFSTISAFQKISLI